jgi:hypothetical protein
MAASTASDQSTAAPVRCAAAGRLERVKTEFNGNPDYSYSRWTYPSSGNKVNQYAAITDGAGEAYSFTQTDGLGRTRFAATEHPGSTGGYSTVRATYDASGRAFERSVPTETNASAAPAGDDAAGYLYTTQTFDWKGRPLTSINTDGTQTEASYGGCGCAGGEVVTLLGESVPIPNTNPVQYGRRKQKAYSDFLGRNYKTEVLNWDGGIYTTTVNEYNARDQVRFVKQYQGEAVSGNS